MSYEDDLMNQAIEELQGQVNIGDIVAHRSHKLSYTLIDIINGMAICELPDGTRHTWPISELFDVNKVKNRAIQLQWNDAVSNRLN